MIAQLDKNYYLADFLRRKRLTYFFLTKIIDEWKLQKTDNLCGFYAIYSAFLFFNFFQKKLIYVHNFEFNR